MWDAADRGKTYILVRTGLIKVDQAWASDKDWHILTTPRLATQSPANDDGRNDGLNATKSRYSKGGPWVWANDESGESLQNLRGKNNFA